MRNMIQYSSIWMPECCGGAIVGRFQGRGFAGGGAGSSSCLLALASSVTRFGHCFKPPSTLCADASCPHRRCILITKTYHILVQRRHLRCWVRLPRRLFLLPVRQRSCFSPGRVSSSASERKPALLLQVMPKSMEVMHGVLLVDIVYLMFLRMGVVADLQAGAIKCPSTMDSTSLLPASQQLLGSWLLASLEGEEMKTASQTGDSDSLLLVDNFWEEIGFPTPASRWWDRNSSDSHSLVGTTISTQKNSPGQTLVRGNGGSTRRWLGNVVRKQQFQRPHLPRFGGNNAGKEGLLKGSTTLSASSIREPIPGRRSWRPVADCPPS